MVFVLTNKFSNSDSSWVMSLIGHRTTSWVCGVGAPASTQSTLPRIAATHNLSLALSTHAGTIAYDLGTCTGFLTTRCLRDSWALSHHWIVFYSALDCNTWWTQNIGTAGHFKTYNYGSVLQGLKPHHSKKLHPGEMSICFNVIGEVHLKRKDHAINGTFFRIALTNMVFMQ